VNVVAFAEPSSQQRNARLLLGEVLRIGVSVRPVTAQLRDSERTNRCKRRRLGGPSAWQQLRQSRPDHGIVAEDRQTVAAEVNIRFDRGHAQIECQLEPGQRIFGSKAAGPTMALEIEGGNHGRRRKKTSLNKP
jgi:hypothetical protein